MTGVQTCALPIYYFLNFMNYGACIERCVTGEDFKNVQEETSMAEEALAEVTASA